MGLFVNESSTSKGVILVTNVPLLAAKSWNVYSSL